MTAVPSRLIPPWPSPVAAAVPVRPPSHPVPPRLIPTPPRPIPTPPRPIPTPPRPILTPPRLILQAASPITPSWHSVADVNDGAVPGLRKSSKPLPPSVTGPVRVITFEGIDTNTCCGTHVQSTARLQAIKLLRTEKAKGFCKVCACPIRG